MRFVFGALFFWVLALVKGVDLPKGRALAGAVLYGALAMGISFTLIYWGLVQTPASLYQILMATVPLLTLFLATMHGLEAFRSRGLMGALLSVAGIAAVVGGSQGATLSLPHIAGILLAAASMAEAGIVVKKFPSSHPIIMNAVGMTVGAAMLTIVSLVSGETWTIPTQATTWLAFGYIVIFVTVIALFPVPLRPGALDSVGHILWVCAYPVDHGGSGDDPGRGAGDAEFYRRRGAGVAGRVVWGAARISRAT